MVAATGGIDGGQAGMLGLLYELLIVRNVTLSLVEADPSANGAPEFLDAIGELRLGDTSVIHQFCGTDIGLTDEDGLVMIQCKASTHADTITLAEVRQVLVDGAKHLFAVRQEGDLRALKAFVLVSNRPADVLKALPEQLTQLAVPTASNPKVPLCLKGRGKHDLKAWIAALKDTNRDGNPPIEPHLHEHVEALVLKLRFSRLNATQAEQYFRRICRQHGLLEGEIDDIGRTLLGDLLLSANTVRVDRTAFQRRIGRRRFCATELSEAQESEFINRYGLDPSCTLPTGVVPGWVRREAEKQCEQWIAGTADQRPGVLLLSGAGGMGKTALVSKCRDMIQALLPATTHVFGFYDGINSSQTVLDQSLSYLFPDFPYLSGNSVDHRFVSRLRSAVSACQQNIAIWILALDADHLPIERLEGLFMEALNANKGVHLILTARTHQLDFATLIKAPLKSGSAVEVVLGLFTMSELVSHLTSDGSLLQLNQRTSLSMEPSISDKSITKFAINETQMLQYLRHPIAFQAYASTVKAMMTDSHQSVSSGHSGVLNRFLSAESGVLTCFFKEIKYHVCERIKKHMTSSCCGPEDVERAFEVLAENRQLLDGKPFSGWRALLSDLPGDCAESVLNQLRETEILGRTSGGGFRWVMPYK